MQRQVVEFSKYNPSGNMTILVHSQHCPSDYARIANQLMASTHVCCEQVGFIESMKQDSGETFRLVMNGNEFCGNATMSYIQYLKEHKLLTSKQCYVDVSGCEKLVPCTIHDYQLYEVGMPQAQQVSQEYLHIGQQVWQAIKVTYDSYVHYVIPIEEISPSIKHQIEQYVKNQQWDNQYKTIGIMLFHVQNQFLHPLIYIPEVESLIWENSCGSGAATIGVFNNYQSENPCADYIVYQPGGSISVTSKYCPTHGYRTSIKGSVSTVASGKAYIEQETIVN